MTGAAPRPPSLREGDRPQTVEGVLGRQKEFVHRQKAFPPKGVNPIFQPQGLDSQAPSLRLIHPLKGRGSVKKRTPLYLAILGAFVLIFVEIARYSYINRGLMRQENVSHLQASYAQVARTFALFAERNWKLLDEWDSDLPNQFYNLTSEEA